MALLRICRIALRLHFGFKFRGLVVGAHEHVDHADEERRRAQKLEDEERRRAQKLEDEARRKAEREKEKKEAEEKRKAERIRSKIETQLISAGGQMLKRGLLGILKK